MSEPADARERDPDQPPPGGDAAENRGGTNESDSTTSELVITPDAEHAVSVSSAPSTEDDTKDPAEQTVVSNLPPFGITFNDALQSTEQISVTEQPKHAENLQIGSVIGHFEITKYIGGGGMGRVYEAHDIALDRRVAIKVLPRQRAADQASVARFFNEARSAARLNHEHIAQVYFCGQEDGIPYIAFEYVQGLNLRSYVTEHGVLPLATCVRFLLQISDALAHAANNGVTHRDVKPSNIIITPDQKAKLIDMGLARLLRSDNPEEDLTVSGVTLGTFDYISPEQARDPRLADARSDIYSLGCTFFFMMTGRPPFPEGTMLQKLLQHQGDKPPDIRQFVPDTPPFAAAIMEKMMAKDPADRYQKPEDLIADLNLLAEEIGLKEHEQEEEEVRPLPKGTKRRLFAYHLPWICALVILTILSGYVWFSGESMKNSLTSGAFQRTPGGRIRLLPSAHTPNNPKTEQVTMGTLPAYRLGARRLPRMNESVSGGRDSGAIGQKSRDFGGIGPAPFSSSDLPNTADSADLSMEAAKLLEQTVDSESDLWSGGWSSIFSDQASRQTERTENGAVFREGFDLVVDRKGKKDGCYTSLDDAVASLMEWNKTVPPESRYEVTIRLAYEGEMEVSSLPLTDCKVKLIPAPGYTPRIVFKPGAESTSLFTLRSAGLTISKIPLFFDLTAQEIISDEWTLIRFDSASSVHLEQSEMTIRNRFGDEEGTVHPNSAFFRVIGAGTRGYNVSASASQEVEVNLYLDRSVIKGEASFLAVDALASLSVRAENSAILIDGPCLKYEERVSYFSDGGRINTEFDGVLLWSRSPLFRIVYSSIAQNNFGKEIGAAFNRSLLILSGNPIGEILTPSGLEEKSTVPNWKLTESLIADSAGMVRYGESRKAVSGRAPASEEALGLFGNNNVTFKLTVPPVPFWNLTRDDVNRLVFLPAHESLDSEISRQWLGVLDTSLPLQ